MRNLHDIIFIWVQTYGEIFKYSLVCLFFLIVWVHTVNIVEVEVTRQQFFARLDIKYSSTCGKWNLNLSFVKLQKTMTRIVVSQ